MQDYIGTAFLVLTALFFIYTTWSSVTSPETFACRLGLSVANAGGVNEIRSQYAGFFLAAAALCILSLGAIVPKLTAYIMLLVIFGGLSGGRFLSLGLNKGFQGFGPAILALYVIDGVGFVVAASLVALH